MGKKWEIPQNFSFFFSTKGRRAENGVENMFGCCMGDRGGGEGYYDDDSDASSCSDASDSRGGFKGISSRRKGGRKKGRRRKGKKPRRTVELDERRTAGQRSRADLEAESERRMREIDARMLRQQGEHEERAQERIDNLRLRAQAEHDKLAQQLRHTQLELQLEHERAERAKVELAQKQATFDQLEAERQAYFDSLEKVKNNIGADVGHLQDELRTKAEEEKARLANEVSRAKDELTAEHDKFVAAQTQLEAKRREAQEHEAKHKADMDAHEAKWRQEHDREEQLRKELEAKAKADHDQLKKEVNALHKDLEREHEKTAEAWSAVNEKQATIECLEAEHEAAMANLETKLREEQQELEARIKSNQERLEREAEAARGELLKEQEKTAREKDQRERFEREVSESKALLAAAQSAEAEAKAKAEEAAAAANQQARKAAADAKRKAEEAAAAAAQRQAEEAATAAATRQAAAAPQHANHRDGAPAAAGSDAAARRSGHSQGGADASAPSGAAAATASAPDDPGLSSEERAKAELKAVRSLEDSIPKCENTFLFKHAADLGSLTSDGAGDSDAVIERWEGAPGLLTKVEGCEAALRELDEAILAAEACAPNSTGGFRSNAAGNDLRSKADALSKSLSGSIATAQSAAARWEKNAVLGLRDSIAACKATEMYANMVRSKLGETKPESSDASSTVQMGGALTLLVLVERCEVAVDGLDQAIRDAERCAPVGSSGFRFESKGGDLKTEAQTLSAELCAAIEDAQAAATSAEAKAEAKAAAAARGMPDVLQWTLQNRRLALSLIDEEVPETLKFTKKERNSLMEAGDTPQWIYVEDKEHGYIPAKVTGHHEGKPLRGRKRRSLEVVSADGRHFDVDVDVEGGKEIVQQIEDPSTLAMIPDDLADTVGLNEGTLLHHLRARFHHDHFYTSLGHVLISINPFKWNKLLYAKDVIQFYVDNRQLGMRERSLPPHTFAVAERAFLAIAQRDARNQSIIISGESGAGKTEVAKQCLAYLAAVSMARKKKTKKTDDGSVAAKQDKFSKSKKSRKMQSTRSLLMMGYAPGVSSKLVDKIVLANPILEAFGNAKTLRNSNSSRFGKWLIVHYDDGHSILGCANKVYLLEKSRVTFQSQGERNFHIFYLLLEGADEDMRESLCLSREALEKAPHADAPSDSESLCAWFHYVNQSGVFALGGKHDEKAHYDELIHSLETLQFDEDSIQQIFNCVAAILHLGNVSFVSTDTNGPNQASKDGCRVTDESKPWLETAAKLLGVPCDGANGLGVWLCRHKMHNKGRAGQPASLILIGHKPEKAANVRDATAKALYSKLFLWLVERINVSAGPEDVSKSQNFIGLLDIFGFEVFEKNGFDQLCIN